MNIFIILQKETIVYKCQRAVGHAEPGKDSITGTNVGYHEIPFDDKDELHIFSFSDGCGDVFDPNEIL